MLDFINDKTLAYISDNMFDAVCITKKTGEMIYLNPAASELFGVSMESYNGVKIWDAIPLVKRNDSLVQLFIDAITSKTKTQKELVEYINNEKKIFHLLVSIAYTEEELFLIIISDLTQLIKVNAAFERYTSPEIAEFVLTDPKGEKQGGKAKEVTVLMSDLRGFTAMSASLTPEHMIKVLNHYFEKMIAVIEQYNGTVIEFLGDGIFVVFNAPKDDPDHAENAVTCAIEMQNAMLDVNEWNRKRDYPELEMGIGINSGLAIVGNIGSKLKMKYGVMGYTVNLAGRLEGLTVGGQIFITDQTRSMVSSELQIKRSQSILPKGGAENINVYEIQGVGKDHFLHQGEQHIIWLHIDSGMDLEFHLLDGKKVEPESHTGQFTAISQSQRFAMLQTDTVLKPGDNIMINDVIDSYAKVINSDKDNYMISFTMRPDGFSNWIKLYSKEQL